MKKILIVDDDALMRRSLAYNLEQAGYQTTTAANAEDALAVVRAFPPDLVLLDIGLPEMDGLDAIKMIKSIASIPVIFVTARHRNLDEVVGLELGADDYITKPFDVDVLIAHMKAVFRRIEESEVATKPESLQVGKLKMDLAAHTVSLNEKPVELSPKMFDLLYQLVSRPNRVITTDELLKSVWGAEYEGEPQVVYVHIRWLREKLEEDPNHPSMILTVRGVGYKFKGGSDAAEPA